MNQLRISLIFAALIPAISAGASRAQQPPSPQVVDLKASDGTVLKATYFAAGKPGPGVLLYHQSNRTRTSWEGVARQLAAAGINTLTIDDRGYGESSGNIQGSLKYWAGDLDLAFQFLVSQPGVARNTIGVAGAGGNGVEDSVEMASRHSEDVKSLILLSGETLSSQMRFLRQASRLPELFIVADNDEYPPTRESMEWMYITSSSIAKRLMDYPAAHAPWLWYETSDASKVVATGSHGIDLFKTHPDLPGAIVDWFVTTLIKTPGHAPVDALACAAILKEIDMTGGVARATQQLTEARRKDPDAQLWPEVNVDVIGEDHGREAETELEAGQRREAEMDRKTAIEIFKLNILAYPDSADAHFNLADAYLQDGQKDLARQYAEKALAMIDSHAAPLSSWSDTEPRRSEIRKAVEDDLKKLNAAGATPTAGLRNR